MKIRMLRKKNKQLNISELELKQNNDNSSNT